MVYRKTTIFRCTFFFTFNLIFSNFQKPFFSSTISLSSIFRGFSIRKKVKRNKEGRKEQKKWKGKRKKKRRGGR